MKKKYSICSFFVMFLLVCTFCFIYYVVIKKQIIDAPAYLSGRPSIMAECQERNV
jgi:hypothetical protein